MKSKILYSNSPYQETYAKILSRISILGLIILFVSFFIYTSGILKAWVPLERLPLYWGLPLGDFISQTHSVTGWGWAGRLDYGDYLNFVGIALLAGVTLICYLVLLYLGIRDKKKIFSLMVILELLLLIISATNIIPVVIQFFNLY